MAVNVEYVIKLNDQLTRKLKGAQTQVDKLNNKVTKTKSSFSGLGGMLARVGAAAAIGMAAKSIITLGVEMEQTRVAFATFLGSAEKGNEVLAKLNKFANVTPFDNAQVIAASKTLLAFGITAEEIEPTLKMLGDVAAGTGKDLSEMGRIFGKIKGNGRLMGEELNMLIDAGFNPLQQISERTGESMLSLKKKMEKGQISFEDISDEFKIATSEGGRFADMMDKQSKTVGGRFSTLLGQLQTVGIAIGEAINPVLGVLVSLGSALLENKTILKVLGVVVVVAAAAFLGWKIAAIGATVSTWTFTGAVAALNAAMVLNPAGLIVAGIVALIAVFVIAWNTSETFRGVLLGLWEAIKVIGVNVYKFLIEPFTAFKDLIVSIFTLDFDGFIDAFKRLGKSALTYILQPLLQIAKVIDKFAGTDLAGSIQSFTGMTDLTAGAGKAFGEGFEKGKDKEEDKEASLTGSGSSLTTKSGAGGTGAAGGSGALGAKVSEVKANAPKVFNINIEKLVEALNISTTNLKDSSTRIKEEVERALLTAITDASIISE